MDSCDAASIRLGLLSWLELATFEAERRDLEDVPEERDATSPTPNGEPLPFFFFLQTGDRASGRIASSSPRQVVGRNCCWCETDVVRPLGDVLA